MKDCGAGFGRRPRVEGRGERETSVNEGRKRSRRDLSRPPAPSKSERHHPVVHRPVRGPPVLVGPPVRWSDQKTGPRTSFSGRTRKPVRGPPKRPGGGGLYRNSVDYPRAIGCHIGLCKVFLKVCKKVFIGFSVFIQGPYMLRARFCKAHTKGILLTYMKASKPMCATCFQTC